MENGHCVLLGNFVTKFSICAGIFGTYQYFGLKQSYFQILQNNLKNLQPLTDYIYQRICEQFLTVGCCGSHIGPKIC